MKINFFRLYRIPGVVLLLVFLCAGLPATSRAQTVYSSCVGSNDDCSYLDDGCATLTNLCQVAAAFDEPGLNFPLIYPFDLISFNPMELWVCDFTSVPSGLAAVTNYPGQVTGGVTNWPLRVTRNMLTDQVTISYPSIDPTLISGFGWEEFTENYITNEINLLQVSVVDDPSASSLYSNVLRGWNVMYGGSSTSSYTDLVASFTNLAPARLVIDVWIMDANQIPLLESNTAPPAVSSDGSSFSTFGSGRFTMDDLTSCSGTVTDGTPYEIISIYQDTNFWTTITWAPTCSDDGFVYGVLSTGELNTNTQWTGVAAMWGSDGSTSWTDTNSASFTQYFYEIVRMPGNGDFSGGGVPNWWALSNGLNPLDLNIATEDPDNDFWSNFGEYLNGTDPNNSNSLTTFSFTLNGGADVVSNGQVHLGFPVGLAANYVIISESITMSNSVTNSFTSPLTYTLLNTNDGLHMLYLQLLKTSGAVSTIFGETFEVDTHPPTISISSPTNGVTVATRKINIQGFAADAATNAPALDTNRWLQVTVNGDFVNDRDSNGLWWAGPENLIPGTNNFTAVATDQAGFSVSNSVWIIYDPTLATNVPVLTVDTTNTVVVGSNATTIAVSGSIDSDNATVQIIILNATNIAITNAIVNAAVHGTNWWAEIPALSGSNVVIISAQNSGSSPVTNSLMTVQNPNVFLSIISPADGTDINSSNVLVVGIASTNFNGTITINGLTAATSTGSGGILFSNIVPISNMNANIIEVEATGTDGSTASVQEIVYGYEVLNFQETLNGAYNHLSSDCWYAQHFPSSYYYRDTQVSITQWAAPESESEQTESLWAYTLDGSTPPDCSGCDGTPSINYYEWDSTPYGLPVTGMGWVRDESYAEGVHLSDASHGGDDQPFSFCLTNADCVCTNAGPYCIGVDTSGCCVPEAHRNTLENDQWDDTITFIKHWPTDEDQVVMLHFNEMSYWLPPTSWDGTDWTEASDPSKITYKGQPGFFYSLSPWGATNIAFLVKIKTNTPYTISKSDFTYPTTSASYTHTEANGTSSVTFNTVYSRKMLFFDGIGNDIVLGKVQEISFTGSTHPLYANGDHGGWGVGSAITNPVWVAGGVNNPACYTKGATVGLTVKINLVPPIPDGKTIAATLVADGGALKGSTTVSLSGSNLTASLTMDAPLSNMVYNAAPTFKWSFVIDGTSNQIDSTSHAIYATYANPISDGGSLTQQRLDTVIKRASGGTNIIGIADSIYNLDGVQFDSRTDELPWNFGVTPFSHLSGADDRWYMYSPVEASWDIRGSCVARATLNLMELHLIGVNAGSVVFIMPIANSNQCSLIEQPTPFSVATNISCEATNYTALPVYCDGSVNSYEGTLKVTDGGTTKYYAGMPNGDSVTGSKPIDILNGVATEGVLWIWANPDSVSDHCKVTICANTNAVPIPMFDVPSCP